MTSKRLISTLLIVMLAGVWGTIIYRVVGGASSADTMSDRVVQDGASASAGPARYVYADDVKDPFLVVSPAPRKSARDSLADGKKKEIVAILPPPYKLNGILTNTKRKVAIVESVDGSIFFLSEKDTMAGITIVKIDSKKVAYVYHAQQMLWQLE
jgi:hypothetical protein